MSRGSHEAGQHQSRQQPEGNQCRMSHAGQWKRRLVAVFPSLLGFFAVLPLHFFGVLASFTLHFFVGLVMLTVCFLDVFGVLPLHLLITFFSLMALLIR